MIKKPTNDLMNELGNSKNINSYLNENKDYLIDKNIAQILTDVLNQKNLKKSDVIQKAEISEVYGYQLFSGVKTNPSRDKILCICIAMELNLEETQNLLKLTGFAPLYPKSKRDSIIIFGINSLMSVFEINNSLYDQNEKVFE